MTIIKNLNNDPFSNERIFFAYAVPPPTDTCRLQQTRDGGLQTGRLNSAAQRIRMLTMMDFPQSGLDISDDGIIVKSVAKLDTVAVEGK